MFTAKRSCVCLLAIVRLDQCSKHLAAYLLANLLVPPLCAIRARCTDENGASSLFIWQKLMERFTATLDSPEFTLCRRLLLSRWLVFGAFHH